jgi:hypothetical protein
MVWQVTNVIQTSIGSGSCISDLVVFPKSGFLLGPPVLRHIRRLALLRLLDGTVWMLALRGEVWSDERLHTAGEILHRVSRQAFTKRSIEYMLRKELDIRSVSLESLPIDRVEIRRWDIEKVAFAF